MHEFNCFITLTYDDQHVPQNYSLNKRDPQTFIKRLRRHAARAHKGLKLRFYLAGEYGDLRGRPHYHAAIFGYDFPDRRFYKFNEHGQAIYTSEILSRLWPHGDAKTAALDYGSAGYIARYCAKKRVGSKAADYYYRYSPIDGQLHTVQPERAYMSLKPGIGANWANKFHNDWVPDGFVTTGGHPQPIPRYYEKFAPEKVKARWKKQRTEKKFENIERYRHEHTDARRWVRAEVRNARIKSLKRTSSGE